MIFKDRKEAGQKLVQKLQLFKGKDNVIIFGIPRGGVVVAAIVAEKLGLSLDIVVVKKIGAPGNLELAIGALGPKNTVYWDKDLCVRLGVNKVQSSKLKAQILKERKEKERTLRGERKPLEIKGKTVILIDDGIATGATVLCALKFFRQEKAKAVILAVPVIAKETFNNIKRYFDKVVVLSSEENFYAVGQFYQDFPQVEDEEVIRILNSK